MKNTLSSKQVTVAFGSDWWMAVQNDSARCIDFVLGDATGFHKQMLLEYLWEEIAMAGYFEVLVELTKRLDLGKDQLVAAAFEVGRYRSGLVGMFCKEFLDTESSIKVLKTMILQCEEEDARVGPVNSIRLGTLRYDLDEAERGIRV